MPEQVTISPIDNTVYVTRTLATTEQVNEAIERSKNAFFFYLGKMFLSKNVQILFPNSLMFLLLKKMILLKR